MSFFFFPLLSETAETGADVKEVWFCKEQPYRVRVTVNAGMYAREDELVRFKINTISDKKSFPGEIDLDSIRVTMKNKSGKWEETPWNFIPDAKDEICWRSAEKLEEMETKDFMFYFNTKNNSHSIKPSYPPVIKEGDIPQNLVLNPSFEDVNMDRPKSPQIWEGEPFGEGTGSIEVVSDISHSGKRCLKITATSGKSFYTYSVNQHIKIKPDTAYKACMWYKGGENSNENISLLMDVFLPGYVKVIAGGDVVADSWNRATMNMPVNYPRSPTSADTVQVKIFIYTKGGTITNPVSIYIDDIEIFETGRKIPPMDMMLGVMEEK